LGGGGSSFFVIKVTVVKLTFCIRLKKRERDQIHK
jgi:hypothetical protein